MTITQLEYIIAVEKLRHFGKAAKACAVSQPTLSMQLQKAEEELGVIFFDRSKNPILPTDDGLKIVEQARLVIREYISIHMSHTTRFRTLLTYAVFINGVIFFSKNTLFVFIFSGLLPNSHNLIKTI